MSATLIYLPMRKTIGVNEPARLVLIFVLMLAACAAISPVRAQSYPARPIRLVIPFLQFSTNPYLGEMA